MTLGTADSRSRVVTFVFTDIEGSSRLWEKEADRMPLALSRHDAIVRTAVDDNRGVVIKMVGDGVHAAFDDPLDALLAAVAIQQALARPADTNGIAFRVRCGLHTGAVEHRDNDYFGNAVNRAARIAAAAHGGQILVSQAVATLVTDRLPAELTLRGLGAVRLKDLALAEQIFQLDHAQIRNDFPPLRSLESTPNNLPQQITSFVGRTAELADATRLLERARILTLLGTGGIGKTRLSLQLAAQVLDTYPDGVWYVDLAPITDPARVDDVLARLLNLREAVGTPIIDTLCEHLRSGRVLVVLDNCEHLLTACATLADKLIHAGPTIQVLATSREPLRIAGEQLYPLPVLALPDAHADLSTLMRADAVCLFVERARLQQPGFTVGEDEASAVAQICSRLDGIPLALELAAARVGTLGLERIASRLGDRLGLLSQGTRTALPRQQALRALIDWSHDLLEPVEKTLFARLSVFSGDWSLAATEAVTTDREAAPDQVVDALDRLVAKSLVMITAGGDRYRLLETIREYARGRLQAQGEEEILQARHHEYFLAMAEEAEPFLRSRTDEVYWLHRLETDHDNLKSALQWSLAPGRSPEKAVRLCAALGQFWNVRGHWREGRDAFSAALRQDDGEAPPDVRGKAVLSASILSFMLGEYAEAETWLQEALAIARTTGNRGVEAGALNNLSAIVQERGDFTQGRTLLEQAVAINRELGNHAWATINLANLGEHSLRRKDFDGARAFLEQALAESRSSELPSVEADSLGKLAFLEQRSGNFATARQLAERSLAIYRTISAPAQEVELMRLLANVSVANDELTVGARHFEEALRSSRKLGNRISIARCLEDMIALGVKTGSHIEAATLFGAAKSLRQPAGVVVSPDEHERLQTLYDQCLTAVGEPACQSAVDSGRHLSTEAAIATALAWLTSIA